MRSAPPQGWRAASRANGEGALRRARGALDAVTPPQPDCVFRARARPARPRLRLADGARRLPDDRGRARLLPPVARRRGRDRTPCGVGRRAASSVVTLLDLTPRGVIGVAGHWLPDRYLRALRRYRYGPGVFKLDWALDGPVPWAAEECARAGTVHRRRGGRDRRVRGRRLARRGARAAVHDRRATEPIRRDPGAGRKARSGRPVTSRTAQPWT